jgi:hypothetical protein
MAADGYYFIMVVLFSEKYTFVMKNVCNSLRRFTSLCLATTSKEYQSLPKVARNILWHKMAQTWSIQIAVNRGV